MLTVMRGRSHRNARDLKRDWYFGHRLFRAVLVTSVLGVVSCDRSTAPEPERRQLATLIGNSELDPHIGASVTGRNLQVSIRTYARRCDERASTEVVVTGMDVLIVPFNTQRGCPELVLLPVEHWASIDLPTSGVATLRIRGLDVTGGIVPGDTVIIERQIDVP
jgi:hypothetical protein